MEKNPCLELAGEKSTLVQVTVWCLEATSHNLSQCWPSYLSPYGVTGPQRVTWASYQIRKIAGCACAGNAGNVSPAAEFKGKHELAIPACITTRASRTWRDACRDCLPAVAGKTFPAFPAHAHPQFDVFGKRPIVQDWSVPYRVCSFSHRSFHFSKISHSHYQHLLSHLYLQHKNIRARNIHSGLIKTWN